MLGGRKEETMNNLIQKTPTQISLLILFTLILAGCASPATEEPAPLPITIPETGDSELQAALTANESNITVQDEEQTDVSIAKFETVNVPVGDLIKLDELGRGVLRFGDRNEINLFGSTELLLDDLILEPGGSTFARLKQIAGHTHLLLNEETVARVTLETDDSTITTLEQGTEFAVCFAPGKITCIAVQQGAIEVISQNEKAIFQEGEATYYTPDQPPQPAICLQGDEFNQWLIDKRGPDEVQTLGQLVQSWPQEPCEAGVSPLPAETNTLTPSQTITITPSPTLKPETIFNVSALENAACYYGPRLDYPIISYIEKGDQVLLVGRSLEEDWILVEETNFNNLCWLQEHKITVQSSVIEDLTIATPPPTSTLTPVPSNTPTHQPHPDTTDTIDPSPTHDPYPYP
jgi:hypothetical protein